MSDFFFYYRDTVQLMTILGAFIAPTVLQRTPMFSNVLIDIPTKASRHPLVPFPCCGTSSGGPARGEPYKLHEFNPDSRMKDFRQVAQPVCASVSSTVRGK